MRAKYVKHRPKIKITKRNKDSINKFFKILFNILGLNIKVLMFYMEY